MNKRRRPVIHQTGFHRPSVGLANESTLADEIELLPNALTVRDITKRLRVSDQTVYRMILDQTIPYFRIRGVVRFDPREIARWLRRKSVNAV